MLEITEGESVALPEEHHEVHNLCAIIYDQLTEILKDEDGTYTDLKKTSFDIEETHKHFEDVRNDKIHALEFLAINGMNNELTTALIKHLVNGLIYDFASFMYESLDAAKKGKLTVAYALLRKPLTDVLLILEQILIDKEDFIQKFYHDGEPDSYDPGSQKIAKDQVIRNAVSKIRLGSMLNADFIYQIRYDKSCHYGLNGTSNQAIHIVTSQKHYKTERQGFNFFFLSQDDLNTYWNQYYNTVPYLLIYATAVVDEIVFQFLPDQLYTKQTKIIKRLLTFLVWGNSKSKPNKSKSSAIIDTIESLLAHKCKMCGNKIKFGIADLKLFITSDLMLCDNCFTNQFADPEFFEKFNKAWFEDIGV
jgi:hypothetical protein